MNIMWVSGGLDKHFYGEFGLTFLVFNSGNFANWKPGLTCYFLCSISWNWCEIYFTYHDCIAVMLQSGTNPCRQCVNMCVWCHFRGGEVIKVLGPVCKYTSKLLFQLYKLWKPPKITNAWCKCSLFIELYMLGFENV